MRNLALLRRLNFTVRTGLLAGAVVIAGPARAQSMPDLQATMNRAAGGDVEAQYALGSAYSKGTAGVPQDQAEALKWFRRAADKGLAAAQFSYALACELGRGLAVDERQAFKYYQLAAEQGYAPAQFNVGNMYATGRGVGQDYFEANLWFKQAADNGIVEAQFNLGFAYESGNGVKKDEAQAARWYRLAAERGYARAQYNLGLLLEDGRGVGKDAVTAATLYRAAAEQGFGPAQVNYGVLLSEGRPGVPADPIQAYVWLSRAVQNGAKGEARDALASKLSAEQIAAATRLLAGEQPSVAPATVAVTLTPVKPRESPVKPTTETGGGAGNLVEQLREQSRRLAGQVEALTADKQAAEQQSALLRAQLKDLQDDLKQARAPGGAVPDRSQAPGEVAALTARLGQAATALKQAEQWNVQLTEANQRLQRELDAQTAASRTQVQEGKGGPAEAVPQAALLANLQRDNSRLNDEVKRSTRELLSLNNQLRSLRSQSVKPAPDGGTGAEAEQVAKLIAEARQAQEQIATLRKEKTELEQWSQSLEKTINEKAGATTSGEAALAELRQQQARLEQQVREREQSLERQTEVANRVAQENKDLTERIARTEERLKAAAPAQADPAVADGLRRRLAQAEQELTSIRQARDQGQGELERLQADLTSARREAEQLGASVAGLTAANEKLGRELAAANRGGADAGALRDELAKLRAGAIELVTLREQHSNLAKESAGQTSLLKQQLAEAQQALKQNGTKLTELTQARADLQNQLLAAQGDSANATALRDELVRANSQIADLQRDLASASRGESDAGALRDELGKVRQAAAELVTLREQHGKLGQESAETIALLRQQLAGHEQALEKSGATVAELTAANEQLGRDLATATRGTAEAGALRDELTKLRLGAAELATLREQNSQLVRAAADAAALRTKGEQLTRDNEQLTAFMNSNRRDLVQAQDRVAELEKQLADALTVRTRGGEDSRKMQAELEEANRSVGKLEGTVTELTVENEKLVKDLENAQKSVAAALAAQSQAESSASPEAFQMEISTLSGRIKQLEAQMEEERSGAAREVTTLAGQLQRTRETNKSLTEANRALLSAKENETSAVRDEIARLEGRVRELSAANEELRRSSQKQTADLRILAEERDGLQAQLTDARKVATVLPGLADEKAALQERLEAIGGQMVQLQREHEELQGTHAELITQLTASRQAAEKTQADLAAVQAQTAQAEKAAEAHTASVAELTQANSRLELEREDMRRLVESYRADIARITQTARTAEQQKTEAEKSGQQNIDAITAQMAQVRRELEAARTNQARVAAAYAAQERERAATITQLRTENSALAVRLNQAQGTLDQIAAAARLGTPATTIASGGPAPLRPAPTPTPAAEVRYHTVTEGDSLSRISMRYYGTANRWQEIFQANRDVLQGSSALRIGMQLRIP